MECAVITTYRCNAKCDMCNIWKNPTNPREEFNPDILNKIPEGMKRLNITGGEPMLRNDIEKIVKILYTKSDRLEISTNGYYTDRIIEIAKKFPNITVRISVDGLPENHDKIRGLKNGFDHALRTVLRLKELGIRDNGFGIVISEDNHSDLLDLYHLMEYMDLEFGNAVIHNSFYFHKHDNKLIYENTVSYTMYNFIKALLLSRRKNFKMKVKDWFRAYINLGLLNHISGKPRPMKCNAGTDSFFIDPWGKIIACNGSPESWIMGDLTTSTFKEIWTSKNAELIREKVNNCKEGCWMTGTAVPAMRRNIWVPISWVLKNKIRLAFGKDIILE